MNRYKITIEGPSENGGTEVRTTVKPFLSIENARSAAEFAVILTNLERGTQGRVVNVEEALPNEVDKQLMHVEEVH